MTLNSLIKNIKWRLSKIFLSENQRLWQDVKKCNKDFREGRIIPLEEYSTTIPVKSIEKKRGICIYNGKIKNGGLADRLRGIISVYEVCKELDIDFKLIFNNPFEMSSFLVPNKVDWTIEEDDLNYNTKVTDLCYIDTKTGSAYEAKRQKQWFRKEFKKSYKEFHIRTNAIFAYDSDYSTLFNELFRLSPRLQASIDKQKEILGTNYISTSFRFMNLLCDFNETVEMQVLLTEAEKEALIARNIKQIELLHANNPGKRILVNSDSSTFLKRVAAIEYVYTIPGNITHIDGKNNSDEYSAYEKTFIDFFMIANAEKIYLMRTGQMYNSGYPLAASKIYNRPFEKIEF